MLCSYCCIFPYTKDNEMLYLGSSRKYKKENNIYLNSLRLRNDVKNEFKKKEFLSENDSNLIKVFLKYKYTFPYYFLTTIQYKILKLY